MTRDEWRERLARAIFKATFHPNENEALIGQRWIDWFDERSIHYRRADACLAELEAAGVVLHHPPDHRAHGKAD